MDVVERWSERIAKRVAPDEAGLAAAVGVAYARGGKARKKLWPRSGVQPGAFGPGNYAVDLHLILRGLADARDVLLPLLRGPYVSNLLAAVSLYVALRVGRGPGRPGQPAQAPELSMSERQTLDHALASLHARLSAAGLEEKRAGQVAVELLEELLKDAAEAARFVDALSAVPDRDARPGSSAKTKGKRAWRRG